MGREKAGMKCIGTVLTEREYGTLYSMFTSTDEGNHEVGRGIINGCDIQKSIYWIWKLVYNDWYTLNRMVNLRTKASREFRGACDLFMITSKDEEQFADWLLNKNWLTEEIFQRLKEGIVRNIKERATNKFYDVTIEIMKNKRVYDPGNKPELLKYGI